MAARQPILTPEGWEKIKSSTLAYALIAGLILLMVGFFYLVSLVSPLIGAA